MKKGLLLGALLLGAGALNAQNLYVALQGGYGFAGPSDVVGTVETASSSGDQTSTNTYSSLGGGANIGLNVGYMFTEHLGAELGFNYFLGSSVTTTDVTVPTGNVTLMSKSSQFRLSPSLIVSTGGDFAVYGKAGLVLPVSGSTVSEYRDNANPFVGEVERDFESKGAMSLGFQGAIGVNYNLSDKLSIFGELSSVNLRIKSASRSMTRNNVDGTDYLAAMDTYDKEVTYVDELNPNSNNASYNSDYSTAQAQEDLAGSTSFNALFINVGVKFNF